MQCDIKDIMTKMHHVLFILEELRSKRSSVRSSRHSHRSEALEVHKGWCARGERALSGEQGPLRPFLRWNGPFIGLEVAWI